MGLMTGAVKRSYQTWLREYERHDPDSDARAKTSPVVSARRPSNIFLYARSVFFYSIFYSRISEVESIFIHGFERLSQFILTDLSG